MNISATNKRSIELISSGFEKRLKRQRGGLSTIGNTKNESGRTISMNAELLSYNPQARIIRVSKSVMDACKHIDIDNLTENISQHHFEFRTLFVLLNNDKSGFIKVERFGSELSFLWMTFDETQKPIYNSYSFISKVLQIVPEENKESNGESTYYRSVFVVKLLSFLIYGEITEKEIPSKSSIRNGMKCIKNSSKLKITYCDTLWRQRISTSGFIVKGHFRFQPFGKNRRKRKLIWIEEFSKNGYHRKATVENLQS